MTTSLICQQINKTLGAKPVLRSLDLDVNPSEVVSLLDASGSGKATLLRLIARLMMPDTGRITLGDLMVWSESSVVPPERRRIGMVFQDYALRQHMTIEGNLAFGLKSQRLAAAEAMAVTDRIAVMWQGTIARFDTPERIYEAPADAFVASFIGGFSLLRGRVAGGCFRPEAIDWGLRTASVLQGEGLLVIRPEDARDATSHPETWLSGAVASAAFYGRRWRRSGSQRSGRCSGPGRGWRRQNEPRDLCPEGACRPLRR